MREQEGVLDPPLVDEQAVATTQVLHHQALRGDVQPRVTAGHQPVVDLQVAVDATANHQLASYLDFFLVAAQSVTTRAG
jgi:hypothetical protein